MFGGFGWPFAPFGMPPMLMLPPVSGGAGAGGGGVVKKAMMKRAAKRPEKVGKIGSQSPQMKLL